MMRPYIYRSNVCVWIYNKVAYNIALAFGQTQRRDDDDGFFESAREESVGDAVASVVSSPRASDCSLYRK